MDNPGALPLGRRDRGQPLHLVGWTEAPSALARSREFALVLFDGAQHSFKLFRNQAPCPCARERRKLRKMTPAAEATWVFMSELYYRYTHIATPPSPPPLRKSPPGSSTTLRALRGYCKFAPSHGHLLKGIWFFVSARCLKKTVVVVVLAAVVVVVLSCRCRCHMKYIFPFD